MPNYRYNSPNCTRQNMPRRNMMPVQTPCQRPTDNTCCDDRQSCDELIGMPLAMAYVPWSQWRNIYEVRKGFSRGTIFEDLDKPFHGIGGCQNVR